jgi:predicted HicB family RNase H-like nuclease
VATDKKAITVYVAARLYARIEAAAKADSRSISNYVERALDAVTPHELGRRVAVPSNIPDERAEK